MTTEERWLLEEKYQGEKTEGFFTDLEKLKDGTPLAYLIGHIPFLNTTVYLDSEPLIPRPETEYWVKVAIEKIKTYSKPQVLDLCAGSGCIGVAVAKAIPDSHVSFAEIDVVHHDTILKNIETNDIKLERCTMYNGDLFEHIDRKYDFILTNPPYINKSLGRTEQSVIDHEPEVALYGGINGMEVIQRIIRETPAHLKQGGMLYIEHEPEQQAAIAQLGEECNFVTVTHNDQYNVPRYSILTMAQL